MKKPVLDRYLHSAGLHALALALRPMRAFQCADTYKPLMSELYALRTIRNPQAYNCLRFANPTAFPQVKKAAFVGGLWGLDGVPCVGAHR